VSSRPRQCRSSCKSDGTGNRACVWEGEKIHFCPTKEISPENSYVPFGYAPVCREAKGWLPVGCSPRENIRLVMLPSPPI